MNLDEFEAKLRQQPRRGIPARWREEILGPLRSDETYRLASWWRQWLWPHPAAWAALATAWVSSAPDMLQAFEERTRLMAELSGDIVGTRPSPAERPRSARRVSQVVV